MYHIKNATDNYSFEESKTKYYNHLCPVTSFLPFPHGIKWLSENHNLKILAESTL
jgi:hypothetical protein